MTVRLPIQNAIDFEHSEPWNAEAISRSKITDRKDADEIA
jgi:hypothetical protein